MEISHSIHASPSKSSKNNRMLPEEIIIEILSRLPVKSLLRFRSVCKAWLSEISNSNFTQLHLNHSPSGIIINNFNINQIYKLSPSHSHLHSFTENSVKLDPHPPLLPSCIIMSPANGIVCLGGSADVQWDNAAVPIYFWNPATKQCKDLPPPKHMHVQASLGFGFDSLSSDYKVLRMALRRTRPVVEVYSSNSDSWRDQIKIRVQLQCKERAGYYVRHPFCCATVKGVQYWDGFDEPQRVLTFDMHNEVFGQMSNLPSICWPQQRRIVEFRDSVAFVVHELDRPGIGVWTMDDDDKRSWSKKYSFETFPRDMSFLWFWENGEILATTFCEGLTGVLLYDPQTQESKSFDKPKWFFTDSFGVFAYTESLVSFQGSKQIISLINSWS